MKACSPGRWCRMPAMKASSAAGLALLPLLKPSKMLAPSCRQQPHPALACWLMALLKIAQVPISYIAGRICTSLMRNAACAMKLAGTRKAAFLGSGRMPS